MSPSLHRRTFTAGALAAAMPFASYAQQQGRVPRVAFLATLPASDFRWEVVRQGLRDLGYTDGKTIDFDYFIAPTIADLPQFASRAAASKPDVIVAFPGSPAPLAAKAATTTIPIVFTGVGAPVEVGLVASLGRPGGNVTGVSSVSTDLILRRLQILRETVPGLSRVAYFLQTADPASAIALTQIESAANALGIEIFVVEARADNDLVPLFKIAMAEGAQAIHIGSSAYFSQFATRIAALAAQHRVPTTCDFRALPDAGGLMSYGTSTSALYRRTPYYIDRILKGAKPADLPVEQPTKFEMVLNMKTAKTLGLTIPLLVEAQADEIIDQ